MEQVRTDKMKEMPVNKLMLAMAIPIVLSMILQAVYNIVDSAFVSNMAEHGEDALNALTLAFPHCRDTFCRDIGDTFQKALQ